MHLLCRISVISYVAGSSPRYSELQQQATVGTTSRQNDKLTCGNTFTHVTLRQKLSHFQGIAFHFSSLDASRQINRTQLQHGFLSRVGIDFPSARLNLRSVTIDMSDPSVMG